MHSVCPTLDSHLGLRVARNYGFLRGGANGKSRGRGQVFLDQAGETNNSNAERSLNNDITLKVKFQLHIRFLEP